MSARFDQAIAAFDGVHAEDPEAKELAYAQHMSAWLEKLAPQASEPLRLAARCQHIRRWAIKRTDYPKGAAGYRKWRTDEAAAHAQLAKEILAGIGYDEAAIQRVQSLVRKENIKRDPEAQLIEDVSCVVFLENYFEEFAAKHDEPTLLRILRITWGKMSPSARDAALALKLPAPLRALVEKAVTK